MSAVVQTGSGARRPVRQRVAGAPISWGVCEVPGWGWQYDADTVLTQMSEVGLAATEFGPDGFLPEDLDERTRTLSAHGLHAVGQFVPVVLHDPSHDPLPDVEPAMEALVRAGASTVVLAAASGLDGYDERPVLDDTAWTALLRNLDRISTAAAAHGLTATLHPHVGTMIESGEETARVLAGSTIGLCLDTGHLLIGGGDPVAVAVESPDRIAHVHLKDVRLDWARQVQSGEATYTEAVAGGMYVPLGEGDVDIAAIVGALEAQGYDGWYVLEQDTILPADPGPGGPVGAVRTSLAHLLEVAEAFAPEEGA
ncbi:TIM barrel protein [Phycicoccus sp. Root101]|uniref:TIM barrel protein n=1 Tax=Phycicoccus sp. Root101 TaxID=1736421 RepID=UPI000AADA74A|nr:TIM barrel protein [Phycicoccus sp. Root101]